MVRIISRSSVVKKELYDKLLGICGGKKMWKSDELLNIFLTRVLGIAPHPVIYMKLQAYCDKYPFTYLASE